MKANVVVVNPEHPEMEIIQQAAEIVQTGGLVAFPTETVYGLGANALETEAVAKIFQAKGRPSHNPLIVHVPGVAFAKQLVCEWPKLADRLAEQFWPGSLTLVLTKAKTVPANVTANGPTVAIRVPSHPVALALLRQATVPIAAPSANKSNRLSPTCADHVALDLGGEVDLILDGGPCPGGLESTVLDVTTYPPRLLRPGLVTPSQIENLVGPIEVVGERIDETDTLRSPGMLDKHYAPRTPLELVEGDAKERVKELNSRGLEVGWLRFGKKIQDRPSGVVIEQMSAEPKAYAATLYAALHRCDAEGLSIIVLELPPRSEDWLAVHDRLRRAAGK
ncbi:MAG: L-threonylcarbamoyladenylate synthase [Gemmataceae bacterium]